MENKYEQLLYEKQRNGVLITLNRPEVMNAISDQLDEELPGYSEFFRK